MAGSVAGGKKAAQTNKARQGNDFYKRIGSIGGQRGRTGGFAYPLLCDCDYKEDLHKKASCSGYKGGIVSRRTK
jgi:hypothetical protein